MKLKGKVAIITGGAGGIGSVISKFYLKEGAYVVIAEVNDIYLKNVLIELKNYGKDRVIGIKTDISDINSVKGLIEFSVKSFGTVDILVNTAGIQPPIGPLTEINEIEWIKNININLIGTMLCCKHVLPVMISKKNGKIINFTGGGATFPRPNFSAYASAKAAIARFTETIAEEVKEYGIDVNAIAPGSVNTRMIEEIIQAGDKISKNDLSEAIKIRKGGGNPPELAANLAVFLASDESDGITGKLISAVWDNWKDFGKNISNITNSSLFTLRRVDGMKISEINDKSDMVWDKYN
jgi:3-oxoacyl-[acyl-carrier protein] reductase